MEGWVGVYAARPGKEDDKALETSFDHFLVETA